MPKSRAARSAKSRASFRRPRSAGIECSRGWKSTMSVTFSRGKCYVNGGGSEILRVTDISLIGRLATSLKCAQREREDQERTDRHHTHLAEGDPLRELDLLGALERVHVLHVLELALRDGHAHALAHERDDQRGDPVGDMEAVRRGGAA